MKIIKRIIETHEHVTIKINYMLFEGKKTKLNK